MAKGRDAKPELEIRFHPAPGSLKMVAVVSWFPLLALSWLSLKVCNLWVPAGFPSACHSAKPLLGFKAPRAEGRLLATPAAALSRTLRELRKSTLGTWGPWDPVVIRGLRKAMNLENARGSSEVHAAQLSVKGQVPARRPETGWRLSTKRGALGEAASANSFLNHFSEKNMFVG